MMAWDSGDPACRTGWVRQGLMRTVCGMGWNIHWLVGSEGCIQAVCWGWESRCPVNTTGTDTGFPELSFCEAVQSANIRSPQLASSAVVPALGLCCLPGDGPEADTLGALMGGVLGLDLLEAGDLGPFFGVSFTLGTFACE